MKKVYIFGNPYIEEDNLTLKIKEYLKKIVPNTEFIWCASPDDLLLYISEQDSNPVLIIDVVKKIREPMLITDISKIKINKITSLHDFDLGYFLKLIEQLGIEQNFKIIGIPETGDVKDISEKVIPWL